MKINPVLKGFVKREISYLSREIVIRPEVRNDVRYCQKALDKKVDRALKLLGVDKKTKMKYLICDYCQKRVKRKNMFLIGTKAFCSGKCFLEYRKGDYKKCLNLF